MLNTKQIRETKAIIQKAEADLAKSEAKLKQAAVAMISANTPKEIIIDAFGEDVYKTALAQIENS